MSVDEKGSYVLVDIGSQVTRGLLVEKENGEYKIVAEGSAMTTVEQPQLDASIGVKNALDMVKEKTGKVILDDGRPVPGRTFMFSSDASGGLHMVVTGVIGMISAESAQRAALGAGALLIDQFSKDDGRPVHTKVASMRSMKPDILLMAGGTDGGAVAQVIEMAEIINEADVQPRFGSEYPLPVIFAGNVELQDRVQEALSEGYATKVVDNVRPVIDRENLGPAREGIYDAYMEHVIVHSPGYLKLAEWTGSRIIPSQASVGKMLYSYAQDRGINMIGVDVGGDTTDVYSVYDSVFNRSLNADIGLSYGLSNILKTTGVENILRWLPGSDDKQVRNIIWNLMINHPEQYTSEQVRIQSALAREAISLGLEKHKDIASRLKGSILDRTLSDMFEQEIVQTRINMMRTDVILGKGEVFKHQSDEESALILIDSLKPEGITELALDKSSLTAPLGNLLDHEKEASLSLFNESISFLGTCIAPVGNAKPGENVLKITLETGGKEEYVIKQGELNILPIRGKEVEVNLLPSRSDLGRGRNKAITRTVLGGCLGLIIDTRDKPISGRGKPLGLLPYENGRSS